MTRNMKKIVLYAPRFFGIDEAIRDAFIQLGFEVVLKNTRSKVTIQEAISRKAINIFPSTKRILSPILKYYLAEENRDFTATLQREKPDLLFIIKGHQLFPQTLEIFKRETSTPIVAYQWDDPFYSHLGQYTDEYRRTNFEKGMKYYDYIFVYDPYHVEEIKKRGHRNVGYLPLATDPKNFTPIDHVKKGDDKYDYDVCFVGVPHANRVEVLDAIKNYKLGVFGTGWKKYFLLRGKRVPKYYQGQASGDDVIDIYRASRITLNIHDPQATEGVNTRTFDVLACGARELVDYKKALEDHFIIGEEIAVYRNIDELKELVETYVNDTDLLERISQRGKQRVLEEHSWVQRMASVISTLRDKRIFAR